MTADLKRAAKILTQGLLAGDLREREMKSRAQRLVQGRRWVLSLVTRLLQRFGEGKRPREEHVFRFILADSGFQRAASREDFLITDEFLSGPEMRPAVGAPQGWNVPAICTKGELAALLNMSDAELNWFANAWEQQRKCSEERLRHYKYLWVKKRDGSARLIEAPKQRLKMIQRFVLERILNEIPPHPAVHGFRRGRSIKTFSLVHVGKEVVLKVDLKDFFPSVRKGRVEAVLRTAGYPERVANLLAGICTNTAPNDVTRSAPVQKIGERFRLKAIYKVPHLPQGAPTSPALANLCAFQMDSRVAGLAKAAGGNYTRYADDLVFSGDGEFVRGIERFYIKVCAIILEEGFEANTRKTRIMRRSVSQKAAGVVLNSHLNVQRKDFDRLKAIIHNCLKQGPASQNREKHSEFRAHLLGRIAHVQMINAEKGAKLLKTFNAIDWGC